MHRWRLPFFFRTSEEQGLTPTDDSLLEELLDVFFGLFVLTECFMFYCLGVTKFIVIGHKHVFVPGQKVIQFGLLFSAAV